MSSQVVIGLILSLLIAGIFADINLHNPRGSNDRNCERNENRNNGNRLFDSQNNDKAGYACPRAYGGMEVSTPTMYYYGGSKLSVEWTNQHSCGNGLGGTSKCQLILQYMCSETVMDKKTNEPVSKYSMDDLLYDLVNPNIRDGAPVNSGDSATDRMNANNVNDTEYGYHESYNYYVACSTRMRNGGVWIADQNVDVTGPATETRQNPNANRHGWECAEERDYYPYWSPSPWKDIAVMSTESSSMCGYYKKNSQNVSPRYWCINPADPSTPGSTPTYSMYNTESTCISHSGQWVKVPAWNIPAPDCVEAPWTRDNHLGNTKGGTTSRYNWTLPDYLDGDKTACVFRIRYNISTAEVEWDYDAQQNYDASPIRQDPYYEVAGYNLSLAVNTDQYGRTFQERSYVFGIKKRRSDASAGTIWNLNVRGKRGNIVETYPAVEYDFVPTYLHVTQDDYIHFQWTGSDYNPNNTPNNGEGGPTFDGGAGSDRSNITPVQRRHHIITTDDSPWFGTMSKDQIMSLAYINQDITNCMTYEELYEDYEGDTDGIETDVRNCMKLNGAVQPYFDLGPVKMTQTGTFTYMSTRNNNFSNRSQKAAIYVAPALSPAQQAGIAVGSLGGACIVGFGGSYAYARKYPNGRVAGMMAKMPLLNK